MKALVSALAVMFCAISSVGTAPAQITISTGSINCGAGNVSSLPILSWSVSGPAPIIQGKPSGNPTAAAPNSYGCLSRVSTLLPSRSFKRQTVVAADLPPDHCDTDRRGYSELSELYDQLDRPSRNDPVCLREGLCRDGPNSARRDRRDQPRLSATARSIMS